METKTIQRSQFSRLDRNWRHFPNSWREMPLWPIKAVLFMSITFNLFINSFSSLCSVSSCPLVFLLDRHFNSVINVDAPGRLSFHGNPNLNDYVLSKRLFLFELMQNYVERRFDCHKDYPVWIVSNRDSHQNITFVSKIFRPRKLDRKTRVIFQGILEFRYYPREMGIYAMNVDLKTRAGSLLLQIMADKGTQSEYVEPRKRKVLWHQVYKESETQNVSICVRTKLSEKLKLQLTCQSKICIVLFNLHIRKCSKVSSRSATNFGKASQNEKIIVIRPFIWEQISTLEESISSWDDENGMPCLHSQSKVVDLAFYVSGFHHYQLQQKLLQKAKRSEAIKKCFGEIHFLYAHIPPIYDTHPDGTCFMFYSLFDSISDISLRYQAFFYMEPDVHVIRPFWVDKLVDIYYTELKNHSLWVVGSISHCPGMAFIQFVLTIDTTMS